MPLQIPQLLDHATLAEPGGQVVTATKSNDARRISWHIDVRGRHVLTMDPAIGDLPVGDVLIEDGVIAAVAASVPVTDAEIIDAARHLVLPGIRFGDHIDRIRDYHRIADTYFGSEGLLTLSVSLTEIFSLPWQHTLNEFAAARERQALIVNHTGCNWGSQLTLGIIMRARFHHGGTTRWALLSAPAP